MRMDELRPLYSGAWSSYAFLTFVAHDPVTQDRAYRRFLNPRASTSSFGGSESGQSVRSVEQVLPRPRPPLGPSHLGSTPPPSEGKGLASRRRFGVGSSF